MLAKTYALFFCQCSLKFLTPSAQADLILGLQTMSTREATPLIIVIANTKSPVLYTKKAYAAL
jgi:hypothetical protein